MIDKLLIIDDSPVARRMLRASIPKNKGYEIFEALDGSDGIEKFQQIEPDAVFLDLTMPGLSGYKVLEELKKIDKNAIVIVITADVQPKSIASVMKLGAFTLLKKPAKPTSVEATLEKVEMKLKKISGTE